ncbi:hypothetical protein SAMN05444156_1784 [Verrucomicrobium sp. GAS474]|uniref:hypothetical protein n=1 Tax=Verrucomicrobium sp. GAS474 TaxID=1882831 RepID=UPI00087A9B65|nr:hypothetical protein [Verrucomicrobium sp. GAS474]SDU07007.1 hypothetical protein SAMN05444156_1784 [Verrucomicrobium sp. GAS474]
MALAVLALTALPGFAAQGEPESFSLKVERNHLLVIDLNGKTVVNLPPETIGRPVTVGGYSFTLTYGRNSVGDLAVVLAPSASNPGGLSFSMNGHHVEMDRGAGIGSLPVAVTITVSNVAGQTQTRIEASSSDAPVKVDGQVATVAASSAAPLNAVNLAGIDTVPGDTSAQTPVPYKANGDDPNALGASYTLLPTTGTVTINLNPAATTPF